MFKNISPSALGITGHQSEIIELALSFGFGGMDLNIADLAMRVKLKGIQYARRLIDSAKIRLGTFQLPVDWIADDETFQKELKRLPECAKMAAEIGCLRCVATLSPASNDRPYHENFEFHRQRFQEICKALEPSGVSLGLGFRAAEYLRKNQAFQFIHDLDAMTLLINMVAMPNIGLLLDAWDLTVAGGSPDAVRKLPAQQIIAVQIADLPEGVAMADLDDKSRLLPVAEGSRVNAVGFLTMLKEIGYAGPVTVVPSRGIFQTRRRDMIVKQSSEALDKVWRAAGLAPERKAAPTTSGTRGF